MEDVLQVIKTLVSHIENMELDEKVETLNKIKSELHRISPFKNEPVDNIQWVKVESVLANDYNPNTVAPPEMKLLKLSIEEDGYTQPVVTWLNEEKYEVVDGFHRTRVCKEYDDINKRVSGFLPIVIANAERTERGDRIAATIRHNRARGKHGVESMSDIVLELKRRNWSDKKISEKLGMDQDEVLRLTQIGGLAEMFKDRDFSMAWEADTYDESTIETDREALD